MNRMSINLEPLQTYFRDLGSLELLEPEEEKELAHRYREHDDDAAADRLIRANLRLVVKIAFEYSSRESDILDLVQEGNMGLVLAASRYDPERGVRFSSYAAWWIRAYMLRFIMNSARLVKLGTTQAQRRIFYNLNKEKQALEAKGIEPTTENLAERLGVKPREVEEMTLRLQANDFSIDTPRSPDEGEESRSLHEELASLDSSAEERFASQHRRRELDFYLELFRADLSGRERYIFDERLMAEKRMTLKKIGQEFGVSRERVRQIERRLLGKLRKYLLNSMGEHFLTDVDSSS